MEVLIRLNNQAAGRDKLARIIQYSSKFIWYELQKTSTDRYTIDQWKKLEMTCSSFRKLLRFGRCVDSLYSALSTIHYPDVTIRLTLTLSKIANSLFLFADHIIWLAKAGFLRNVDSYKWNEMSNKYWLLTIVMNLIRDIYEIQKLMFQKRQYIFGTESVRNWGPADFQDCVMIAERAFSVVRDRRDIMTDTIKNVCDLWIPLTALGRISLKPGTVGVLGAISSAAALYALVQPSAKLFPS